MNKHKEFIPGRTTIQDIEDAEIQTMGVDEDDEQQEEWLGIERRVGRKEHKGA